MQQMAGNMALVSPFNLNQGLPGLSMGYNPYSQV